jgi:hypothetical protein
LNLSPARRVRPKQGEIMYDMLVTRMIVDGGLVFGLPVWGLGLAGVVAMTAVLLLVGAAARGEACRLPRRAPAPLRRLRGTRAA